MCKTDILKALGIMPNTDDLDEIPPEYEAAVGATSSNGLTRASEMAVNQSSVVLDPIAGTISLHQLSDHHQEVPPVPENYTDLPSLSSGSDSPSTADYMGVSDGKQSAEDQALGNNF